MKIQRLRDAIQKGLESDTITGEEYQQRFAKKRASRLAKEDIDGIIHFIFNAELVRGKL